MRRVLRASLQQCVTLNELSGDMIMKKTREKRNDGLAAAFMYSRLELHVFSYDHFDRDNVVSYNTTEQFTTIIKYEHKGN